MTGMLVVSLTLGSITPASAAPPPELTPEEREVVKRFTEIYHQRGVWLTTGWLGVQTVQVPSDNWMMQEIIATTKPDYIIETGTYRGGGSLFYATVLSQVNPSGRVITIDINPQLAAASKFPIFKERISVITGSSTAPEVVERIANEVKGRKVLVTLDSLHTRDHVLKELELYAPLVTKGSYLVVQDTVLNGHPVEPKHGPGPMEAVQEFLKTHPEFQPDTTAEKFLLTFYPGGWLKRVK
jgi:cephalosporin hydroxylase